MAVRVTDVVLEESHSDTNRFYAVALKKVNEDAPEMAMVYGFSSLSNPGFP